MDINYSSFSAKPSSAVHHLPGEKGWPLLGHTYRFLTDTYNLSEELYRRHGPVFYSRVLFQDAVMLCGPEANEIVLQDRKREFSSKLAWDPLLDRLFPNGLMLRDFDEHRYHRRILQAAFKKPVLTSYLDAMGSRLSAGIDDFAGRGSFGFKPAIKSLLLDVAAEVFLGVEMGEEADAVNQAFVDTMLASMAVVKLPLPGTTWQRGLKGRSLLEDFIERHIPAKRAAPGADFFSQICAATDEDGNVFSDEAVRDHVIFLLFAAHDTTTSTLCSLVYLLAKHPEWQARLREELLGLGDSASFDGLASLEQCEWVLKETLRMYPPLPSITRRTVQETEVMGFRLPANTSVNLSPLHTHYLSECWDAPKQFDPERFSPERAEHKRHSYQWLPFGGGAHKCIGLNFAELQVKLFLYQLLRNHEVSLPAGYELRCRQVPLNFPVDDLQLSLSQL